jgi:CRP-like cAMP-binding protein
MTRPDPSSAASAREASGDDRFLTAAEVAARVGRARPWVLRHAAELGGRRARPGRTSPWLFESDAVERAAAILEAKKAEARDRKAKREEARREAAAARLAKRKREKARRRQAEHERQAAEAAARREARERAEQARRTAEWKARPWPTISASDVDWKRLSQAGCETLAMIALPIALGFSYAEIAAQAGLSHAEVVQRMRKLRSELEAQVAAREAT